MISEINDYNNSINSEYNDIYIKGLLDEITDIRMKNEEYIKESGSDFNIFYILNVSYKEVYICRVLHELLNPVGSHHLGLIFLEPFINNVLKMDFTDIDFQTAKVYKELPILDNRRIDLSIETTNFKIPIEVKIYAGDQNDQCYDYYQYAKNSKIFYLTCHGTLPAHSSTAGLKPIKDENGTITGYKEISLISWKDLVDWLSICLEYPEVINISTIYVTIKQLRDILFSLTGELREGLKMDITNTIISTPDNMKSAIGVSNALHEAQTIVMRNFFTELKQLFENNGYIVHEYANYDDYYIIRNEYPLLIVELQKINKNLFVSLYIEINDTLQYGFSFVSWNKNHEPEFKNNKTIFKKYPYEYEAIADSIKRVITEGEETEETILLNNLFDDSNKEYDFRYFSDPCVDLTTNYLKHANNIFNLLHGYNQKILRKMKSKIKQ